MRLGKSDLLSWISCSLVGLCSYAAEGMPVRWMHTSSLREVSLQSFGHVSLFAPLQPRCGSTLSLVEDVSDIVLMHNAEKDLSVVALSFDMDEHILKDGVDACQCGDASHKFWKETNSIKRDALLQLGHII